MTIRALPCFRGCEECGTHWFLIFFPYYYLLLIFVLYYEFDNFNTEEQKLRN